MLNQWRRRIGRALLREAAGATPDADDWMYSSVTASGETVNDLNDYAMTKQRQLARNHFFRSPVGGALAEMSVDRVIGGKAQFTVRHPEYQRAADRFAADPYNDLPWLLPQSAKELWAFGELFTPVSLQPENADARLGYIKPDDVKGVIWEPGNEKRAIAVTQRRPKPNEPDRLWVVLHPDPAYGNSYPPHGLLAPDAPFRAVDETGLPVILPNDGREVYPAISDLLRADATVAGYLFYHRSNCLMTGRGRSRYERVNDWIKALDDWFFGILRNAVLQGSFVWDVRIKGGTPQEIKNRKEEIKRSGPPRPGSVHLHNDQEEWTALSPSLSPASSIREILGGVLRLIGVAAGLPGHELGAEQDTNRSTAQESRSIGINRAKAFQAEICDMAGSWIRYMLDQKRYLGALPDVPEEERRVEWTATELDPRDETEAADAVQKLAGGLLPLLRSGLILEKDARTVIYNVFGIDAPSDEEIDLARRARQPSGRPENSRASPGATENDH
jgi:hypothetical protein